jgi:hypothetical protein
MRQRSPFLKFRPICPSSRGASHRDGHQDLPAPKIQSMRSKRIFDAWIALRTHVFRKNWIPHEIKAFGVY